MREVTISGCVDPVSLYVGHWNFYPILDHYQFDFATPFWNWHQKPYPIPDLLFSMLQLYHYRNPAYVNQRNILCNHFRVSISIIELQVNYLYTCHFPGKLYPILDQNCLISLPYTGLNYPKTTPFTAAYKWNNDGKYLVEITLWYRILSHRIVHNYMAYIWKYPSPRGYFHL